MFGQGKTGLVSGLRTLTTSLQAWANHYDVLGVTPKSSQGDIKAAYYKLSKVYHPDKSTDEASAKKFRDITEAYEVLGNVKLKKMYDRGLLVGDKNVSRMTREEEPEPKDPSLRFYKSRDSRNVIPTMDGKVPIYNFDAWAKSHYNNLYEKAQYEKEFLKKKRMKQEDAAVAHQQEILMMAIFVMTSLCIFMVIQGTDSYDKDLISKQNSKEKNK